MDKFFADTGITDMSVILLSLIYLKISPLIQLAASLEIFFMYGSFLLLEYLITFSKNIEIFFDEVNKSESYSERLSSSMNLLFFSIGSSGKFNLIFFIRDSSIFSGGISGSGKYL